MYTFRINDNPLAVKAVSDSFNVNTEIAAANFNAVDVGFPTLDVAPQVLDTTVAPFYRQVPGS